MVKLIIKWIIGALKHPISIIKGNIFRIKNINFKLYLNRYAKCKFCENNENSPIGEICGICGCPLKSKLRLPEETCDLNRW